MKSGEGLDCISFTSCRIRFTAGLLRLNLPVAAIASAQENCRLAAAAYRRKDASLRIGNCREERERGGGLEGIGKRVWRRN